MRRKVKNTKRTHGTQARASGAVPSNQTNPIPQTNIPTTHVGHTVPPTVSDRYTPVPVPTPYRRIFNNMTWFPDCLQSCDTIMRVALICGFVTSTLAVGYATTLQQLSLDDMTRKSTAIVRGTVQLTHGAMHRGNIYTHYTVQVVEQWKGAPARQLDFVLPGGTANGLQQAVPGAPALVNGQEYVLFLWTSGSGLTHVIGMSQGVFVSANGLVTRGAIQESMLNSNGSSVSDPGMQMTLPAMRSRVATVLNGGSSH